MICLIPSRLHATSSRVRHQIPPYGGCSVPAPTLYDFRDFCQNLRGTYTPDSKVFHLQTPLNRQYTVETMSLPPHTTSS
jgi:hypothetical protein